MELELFVELFVGDFPNKFPILGFNFSEKAIYMNDDSFLLSDRHKEINWPEFEEIKAISEVSGDENHVCPPRDRLRHRAPS